MSSYEPLVTMERGLAAPLVTDSFPTRVTMPFDPLVDPAILNRRPVQTLPAMLRPEPMRGLTLSFGGFGSITLSAEQAREVWDFAHEVAAGEEAA